MARRRRRQVTVAVTISIHPGMTLAEAKREVRTRVNNLSSHYEWLSSGRLAEESDVRIKRITKWPN